MKVKLKSVGLTASRFAFGELLDRAPSNQGLVLPVWPLLRRGSLTPTTLRGPAPNGHPCPDGALAASLRLGPLRVVCVRPAPKSRLAVPRLFAFQDQDQRQRQRQLQLQLQLQLKLKLQGHWQRLRRGICYRGSLAFTLSVGAGLLANAVVLLCKWRWIHAFASQSAPRPASASSK